MDGQDSETAGKRKTKNSTSLVEKGERDPFAFATTFALVTGVSPPFVIGGSGVFRDGEFGRRIDQFLKLELRIALEAFVGE